MRHHGIEVDDEIFEFLKRKAEAFVDTPNTVLRRLLLDDDRENVHGSKSSIGVSDVPVLLTNMPSKLKQILSVAYLVIHEKNRRKEATNTVARLLNISTQAVIDKYTRQLSIKAYEFDKLLEGPGVSELRKRLLEEFPRFSEIINNILIEKGA